MSHSRQPSGLISSARMTRAKSPSQTRPNSSLKSIRRMPIAANMPDRKSFTRIAERVVLVIIFDDRSRQLGAFLDPQALGEGAGGDVADHDLDRDDLDLANQLLAHVQATDEMGRDADRRERREDMLGDAVVDDALAADRAALLRVERGRIVLEILDKRARLRTLVEDLGLALIDLAAASHFGNSHSNANGKERGL